jgi:hypothetical protein
MSASSVRFKWLAQHFDALVLSLNQSTSSEERAQLLLHMKFLIDEIDALLSSSPERDTRHPAARSAKG